MLIKTDHRLEQAAFTFDQNGEVAAVTVTVNFAIRDDQTGKDETRVRKTADVWDQLTASQKTSAAAVGKRLRQMAQSL